MRHLLDNAAFIVVFGGIFYGGFYFLRNLWFEDEPKKQKIISACMSVFIAAIILMSVLDVFEPDIDDDFASYATEILDTTDLFIKNDISAREAYEVITTYEKIFQTNYTARRETTASNEEDLLHAIIHIKYTFEDLCYLYGGNYDSETLGGEVLYFNASGTDAKGNWIDNLDSYESEAIIKCRNDIAELLYLKPIDL